MERDGDADTEPEPPTCGYDAEVEIDEVILRLDLTLVRPEDEQSSRLQSANSGPSSSRPENGSRIQNGGAHATPSESRTNLNGERATAGKSEAESSSSNNNNNINNSQQDDDKKKSKPLDFIRKLRQTGHQTDNHRNGGLSDGGGRRKSPEPLKVDSLPQKFIAKYVGCKPCRGLWGIQHTREPVDALVDDLRRLERGEDLPLVRLDVSTGGIGVAVHPRSRSRLAVHDLGLLPLEFISYAVQDTRYSRIFAFILVRELSSRGRSTECHAYLCDSPVSARKLALSVALAFRLYERSLAGKPFRFVVDLRSPEELAAERACAKSKSKSKSSSTAGSLSLVLATECDA